MLKKLSFLILMILLAAGLIACGEESEKMDVDSKELTETNEAEDVEEVEAKDENEIEEFNEELVDNDNIKAELISVEKIVDKEWDEERIEVKFEVENKRDDTIVVQAREVSANGKMVDEMILNMSQEISGGKKADAVLTIENYDGDLPEIKEDIEMILLVADENYEGIENIDVKIDFE